MTTFGSNATFDIRVRDSHFRDTVSTLVKMLEVGVTNGNAYFVDIADSELTNVNPRVAVEASLGGMTSREDPGAGCEPPQRLSTSRCTTSSSMVTAAA